MDLTEGARRFRAFREKHGINYSEAARALRVSRPSIYAWEDGSKVPEADARDRIEVWTGGEVTPAMWRTPDAEKALAEVRPLGVDAAGAGTEAA